LVSAWKLSADGLDSHSTNDLTNNNSVTFVAKGAGAPANMPSNVANFVAASSQYFNYNGINAFIPENTARTIVFWFKTGDVTQVKGLIGVGTTPTTGTPQWFVRLNASLLSLYAGSDLVGGHNYMAGSTTLVNGTWYLVIYSYNHAAQQQRVYLNDSLEISLNAATDWVTFEDNNIYLGVAFPGYITTVMSSPLVYSRVLTAGERTDLYASGNGLFY
jgi:hypothetical protein